MRLILIAAATLLAAPAIADNLTCETSVAIDGDTIRCADNSRIRLSAIDAPELSQTCRSLAGEMTLCGRDARDALRELISTGELSCHLEGRDRWQRAIATCEVDGRDIGQALVAEGNAIPYMRCGGSRYVGALASALASRRGMHAGSFIEPERWRRGDRR